MTSTKFSTFTVVKLDDIRDMATTRQHCSRSPLSWIHYHLLSSNNLQTYCCLPTITNIVNLSLREGCMPTCLKTAVLSPLLKKPDADFLQFKNFKPISSLKALSKVIEKSVALQLHYYLMNNNLHENFQ